MARLFKHQQMALILALTAALVTSPAMLGRSYAVPVSGDGGTDGPGQSPGERGGDPDVPTGSTRSGSVGVQRPVARPYPSATVSDGRVARDDVWMWRLRIVLRGLRAYTFHF